MTSDEPMNPHRKTPDVSVAGKPEATSSDRKSARAQALADALRDNLRRRKAAAKA